MFQIGLVEDSDLDEIAGIDAVAMADNGAARAVEKAIPGSGPRRDIFLMWIRKTFKQDEAHAFWKVVDAETGEIVSAAKWSYYYEPKAPECRRREEVALWRNWETFKKEHVEGMRYASKQSPCFLCTTSR
ncbi:hypothetical protein H2203_001192 [Taxawa tesnikishii (nom. ined.)]|nr:hypothetical protein H2203_001192 [Dothideales sp. JES 119]